MIQNKLIRAKNGNENTSNFKLPGIYQIHYINSNIVEARAVIEIYEDIFESMNFKFINLDSVINDDVTKISCVFKGIREFGNFHIYYIEKILK
jgi:hypothetical protein